VLTFKRRFKNEVNYFEKIDKTVICFIWKIFLNYLGDIFKIGSADSRFRTLFDYPKKARTFFFNFVNSSVLSNKRSNKKLFIFFALLIYRFVLLIVNRVPKSCTENDFFFKFKNLIFEFPIFGFNASNHPPLKCFSCTVRKWSWRIIFVENLKEVNFFILRSKCILEDTKFRTNIFLSYLTKHFMIQFLFFPELFCFLLRKVN
jgi:hypothetical protein